MTLSCKVNNIINIVLSKQFIRQLAVAYITLYKEATLVVDVVLDGTKVSGIGQCVEDNHLDVFVHILFVEQILDEV